MDGNGVRLVDELVKEHLAQCSLQAAELYARCGRVHKVETVVEPVDWVGASKTKAKLWLVGKRTNV